jgi:hypothetical protein
MRTRLSPEQREARRRARAQFSFSDAAYEHYDTADGFGSAEEWFRSADALADALGLGAGAKPKPTSKSASNPKLRILGLEALPATFDEFKSAFRRAARRAHPDGGGSDETFRAVYAAYEEIVRSYE